MILGSGEPEYHRMLGKESDTTYYERQEVQPGSSADWVV